MPRPQPGYSLIHSDSLRHSHLGSVQVHCIGGAAIKRWCCLTSVAYIGPNWIPERPKKTKIGTEVAHITRDSDTTFKVKSIEVRAVGWLPYLGSNAGTSLPHSLTGCSRSIAEVNECIMRNNWPVAKTRCLSWCKRRTFRAVTLTLLIACFMFSQWHFWQCCELLK